MPGDESTPATTLESRLDVAFAPLPLPESLEPHARPEDRVISTRCHVFFLLARLLYLINQPSAINAQKLEAQIYNGLNVRESILPLVLLNVVETCW